jgi:hypothetical protein
MAFCTRCGASNADTARFCGNCGSAIPVAVPVAPVVPVAYVVPRPRKSVGIAILLTFFFGPLGMLYSTVPGALVMLAVSVVLGLMTAGFSIFLTWPVCIVWAAIAAHNYNNGI